MSTDIDLFSDQKYGTINFQELENYLSCNYPYFYASNSGLIGVGNSYFIGENADSSIKLDIYYADPFIRAPHLEDGIRLATVDEIAAMKVDIIQRGGRKKDFWDIHEILETYSIDDLIALHAERYPYTHDTKQILQQFTNFNQADNDFDPICVKGKVWELVKYDILQTLHQ